MSPLKRLASAAAIAAIGVATGAAPALAAGTAGSATQTPPTGTDATNFQVKIPTGAACSGDTVTGNYQVYGYIVPVRYSVSSLKFDSNGPVAPDGSSQSNGVNPLVDSTGSPYAQINTNTGTGAVPTLPQFNYSVFDTSALPPGTYNVGIACAKAQASGPSLIDNYWNLTEQLTATPAAGAGHFSYAFVPPAPAATVPETPFAAALPIAAAGLLGAGAFITVRRRRSAGPTA